MIFPDFTTTASGGFESNNNVTKLVYKGEPNSSFLFSSLNEWKASDTRNTMIQAQDYYLNNNDIRDRKRYYIDRKGIKQEATNLNNSKLNHPFLRKLTKQKVNYLLAQELTIQCEDDNFSDILGDLFNKRFLKMLKNIGTDAIVNGIAWIQIYYDEKGVLSYKRIPPEEIVPFWADAEHTVLEGIIRHYILVNYEADGSTVEREKIEYHTTEGVWYYEVGLKGLIPDSDRGQAQGHFNVLTGTNTDGEPQVIQATWERIPFIPFKYNADEISLLKMVKELIDDYDRNVSDASNHLQDIPDSIKIVKNYDGTDKGEFTQNLNVFRTAFVSGDGDVKSLETKMDIAALDSHLSRLRKDIYEAASGVDTQELSIGNASGVALKFRYADLDTDINDMASEFAASLNDLVWFLKVDLLNNGTGDFMEVDFEVVFNTDMIINESEVIADAKNSVGIISNETILVNHPWVTNAQEELERTKKETEEQMAMFDPTDPNFGNPADNSGNNQSGVDNVDANNANDADQDN